MFSAGRPIMLVLLDGVGDRASSERDGLTPAEAADTPVLDAFTQAGATGLHVPFGLGRAPSSELAHWAIFGYSRFPFCGRAVLEGLGAGLAPPTDAVLLHASLRGSRRAGGKVWPADQSVAADEADARELFDAIVSFEHDGLDMSLTYLRMGQGILALNGARSAEITDSDPMFPHHPWMQPLPLVDAKDPEQAARTATALFSYLRWSREALQTHVVNERRRREGRLVLDVVTTKWPGQVPNVPPFGRLIGLPGAIVASGSLYAGFAKVLDMAFVRDSDTSDPGADIARRIGRAAELLAGGIDFVHVHTKATDEAGHTKDPDIKRAVIERIDHGLQDLLDEKLDAVIAVTGDHATPSTGPLLHSGDPCPLVVRAPGLRPDSTKRFGESHAAGGSLGTVDAAGILPLLLGLADRPAFLGSTIDPYSPLALIDDPAPMPDI